MRRRISSRFKLIGIFAIVLFVVYYRKTTKSDKVRETKHVKGTFGNFITRWTTDGQQRPENSSEATAESRPNNNIINYTTQRKKFFIAFSYCDQFSMASRNLLSLTTLASRTGREVVIPFVNGSKFIGNEQTGTLERYYDIDELNKFLLSKGFATLVSLKTFHDTCQHKLDILLNFLPTDRHPEGPEFYPCKNHQDLFQGFKVKNFICIENRFSSIEIFVDKVIIDFPCVGIKMWAGHGGPRRARFPLPAFLGKQKLQLHHYFTTSLVQIADDFRAKYLGSGFISVHLRMENIPGITQDHRLAKQCLSNLSTKVQQAKDRYSADECKVFVAGDFTVFGSYSGPMVASRRIGGESLGREFVSKLNAVAFDPSIYNLTDRGSVAIIEMLILKSGKELYLLGGGTFQLWLTVQFIEQNSGDKSKVHHPVDCSERAMSFQN